MKPAQTTIQSRVSSLAALTALLTLLWSHLGTTENAVDGSLGTYASEWVQARHVSIAPMRRLIFFVMLASVASGSIGAAPADRMPAKLLDAIETASRTA